MTMLHINITLARLMVYDQYIVESELKRMSRNLKRSGPGYKINLGSRRGLKLKMDLVLLSSNLTKEVVLNMAILLVPLVERNIIGSA